MSRFSKLSHVLWHCQYHIVWVPKYRYRVLKDRVAFELNKSIRVYSERMGCEIVELNVQADQGESMSVYFLNSLLKVRTCNSYATSKTNDSQTKRV